MSSHHPPLTCDDFKAILSKLGFTKRPKKSGTSHEDWVKTEGGRLYKVTVDCPKAPFSPDLISSMAKQAGVTKKQIYDVHYDRHQEDDQRPPAELGPARYEARKHTIVDGVQYWCVWDTHLGKHPYNNTGFDFSIVWSSKAPSCGWPAIVRNLVIVFRARFIAIRSSPHRERSSQAASVGGLFVQVGISSKGN